MLASWLHSWRLDLRDAQDARLLSWLSHPSRRDGVRRLFICGLQQPITNAVRSALAALLPSNVFASAHASSRPDFTALARVVRIDTLALLFDDPPAAFATAPCTALSDSCAGPELNHVADLRLIGYSPRFGPLRLPPPGTFEGVRTLCLDSFTVADAPTAVALFAQTTRLDVLDWSLQRRRPGHPLDLDLARMCSGLPQTLTQLHLTGIDAIVDLVPGLSHLHALQHLALHSRHDSSWWLAEGLAALERMTCWRALTDLTVGTDIEWVSDRAANAGIRARNSMHAGEGVPELDRVGGVCITSHRLPALEGLCFALRSPSPFEPLFFPSTTAAASAAAVAFCVLEW
jgi:hypothetical protein